MPKQGPRHPVVRRVMSRSAGAAIGARKGPSRLATTGGDYHAAVGLGLASPAVLVGVAFLIGTADILWPVRRAAEVDVEAAGQELRRKARLHTIIGHAPD